MHLRAHVQSSRDQPGALPQESPQPFLLADGSTGHHESSGIYNDKNGSIAWSGTGDFRITRTGTVPGDVFVVSGWVDAKQHLLHVGFDLAAPAGLTYTVTDSRDGSVTTSTGALHLYPPNHKTLFDLPLDDNLNVIAGQYPTYNNPNISGLQQITATFAWQAATATSPPTDRGAR